MPAHNASAFVGPCLRALLDAGFAPSEITLVDDASTDDTCKIAEALGINVLRCTSRRGAAQARNIAAEATDGNVLVFVDSDVAVHPDVKERLSERFGPLGDMDAVFGSYDDKPYRRELVSRIRNLLHHHVHQENAGSIASFWTGLGAVRRSAFDACGGFDANQSMMEDIELGMRLHRHGFRIFLDPDLQGTHWKHWSLTGMIRTDLLHRAIPWAKLILAAGERSSSDFLNVSNEGKVSVVSVFVSLCALPIALFSPALGGVVLAAALCTLAYANRSFLKRLHRLEGWSTTIAALGVLWVHFLCGGLGYAAVRCRLLRD